MSWKYAAGHFACVLAIVLVFVARVIQPAMTHVTEIQAYDGDIAAPRIFNLTLHSNYTPAGQSASHHAAGFSTDDAFTLGLEFAYGVTEWLELGVLIPIVTGARGHWQFDGGELRALLTVPHAAERWLFYGGELGFRVQRTAVASGQIWCGDTADPWSALGEVGG